MNNSEYKVEVDRVTESEWSGFLDGFEDANIYQTWAYGSVRWGEKNLSHAVLRRDGEVVAAAQLRIVRTVHVNVGVAYLRWGPLCQVRRRDLDSDTVRTIADALYSEYVRRRGLYLDILPNAFSGSARAEVFKSCFARFDCQGGIGGESYRTFVLDLSPPLEQLRKNLDKKWRNQLNAAERNGLRVVEGDSCQEFCAFRDLYAQMQQRKSFHANVNADEFTKIQERLPASQRMRVFICRRGPEPVAGLVCSVLGQFAIYLLGATNDDGMKLKGSYLLQWFLIKFLKERGVHYYDLGGIDPEANPGVHHFKSGLSGVDLSHIRPFAACDSSLSRVAAKSGGMLRNSLRHLQERFAHV